MKKSIYENLADWLLIYSTDSTGVRGGKYANDNFSDQEHMLCMQKDSDDDFAKSLIRFDLSAALEKDFSKAFLTLYSHQGDTLQEFELYEIADFNQETVTMNNCPPNIAFIKCFPVNACSEIVDITDFIKQKVKEKQAAVSLCITPKKDENVHKDFSTQRKSVKSKRVCLRLLCGEKTYLENLPRDTAFGSEEPFEYAKRITNQYLEHYNEWGIPKADEICRPLAEDPEEFCLDVPAKKSPFEEKYDNYPSRAIETLKGYTKTIDEIDNFGGDVRKTYEATGFFYTKKIDGRWMLIDPKGHPYFNSGICTTWPGETKYQRDCILEKYGTLEEWGKAVSKRFKELRIGSTGGSSAIQHISKAEDPINMMITAGFASSYARKHNMAMQGAGCWIFVNNNCLPVFDPDFESHCDNVAKEVTAPWVDNPYFIGYMTDNEVSVESKTLYNYLLLDTSKAENSYAYAFAWVWLSAVTGKKYPDFNDITPEILEKFRGAVYDRYFFVASNAIKKYDKNHLYMGCRFKSPGYLSEQIMRAEGHYCDICTHNLYFCWTPPSDLLANWSNWNKKPFIVTEFYTKSADTGFKNVAGAGWVCPTQKERAQFLENYVLKLLESDNCVGFHWFRYMDCDPNGFEGCNASDVNSNKGIVKSDSTEYTELCDAMYKVCSNAYSLIDFFNKRRK